MNRLISFAMLAMLVATCTKNVPLSAWRVHGTEGKDSCLNILELADGNVLICGSTENRGRSDMLLIKTDPHGNRQWITTCLPSKLSRAIAVRQLADGTLLMLGDTGAENGPRTVFISKLNTAGELLSSTTVQTAYPCGGSTALIPLAGGGYVVLTKKLVPQVQGQAIGLFALTPDGSVTWHAEPASLMPYGELAIFGTDIAETSDGLVITGFLKGRDGGNIILCSYLMKTDLNGIFKSERLLSVSQQGTGSSLAKGGSAVAGLSLNPANFMQDVYVAGISHQLDSQWMYSFGGKDHEGNGLGLPFCKLTNTTTGYLLCSTTRSFDLGNSLVYVVALTNNGTKAWEKTFGGIKGNFFPSAVLHLANGHILIGGSTTGFAGTQGQSDVFTLTIDSHGNLAE